jgi:transposase
MARRKRRTWSGEEKRLICSQTLVPGVSVAQVARRYLMNANLIFKWLKDPRFTPNATEIEETVFLPVEVSTEDMALTPSLSDDRLVQNQNSGRRIEITLVTGHRLTVEGGFDGTEVARLLKGLVS